MKQKIIIAILSFTITFFAIGQIKQAHAISKIGSGYTISNFLSLATTLLVSFPSTERPEELIDGYARLFHCKLLKQRYKNEFEWQKVREGLNSEIDKLDKEYYRYYEFTGPIFLKQYDFKTGSFPLKGISEIKNVGFLSMFNLKPALARKSFCSDFFVNANLSKKEKITEFLPATFSVKLKEPLTLKAIKVNVNDAKKFVNIMAQRDGGVRRVYIRFRVKISTIYKLRQKLSGSKDAIFNATLKEADIFFDSALTMHFTKIKL